MRKWIWKRRVRWMASEHVRDAKQATRVWLRHNNKHTLKPTGHTCPVSNKSILLLSNETVLGKGHVRSSVEKGRNGTNGDSAAHASSKMDVSQQNMETDWHSAGFLSCQCSISQLRLNTIIKRPLVFCTQSMFISYRKRK